MPQRHRSENRATLGQAGRETGPTNAEEVLGSYMGTDHRPLSNPRMAPAQLPLQGGSDVRDAPGLDEKEEPLQFL